MLEINKIYDQDCLEGMKLLNDRSIDLICTDLPYGVTQNKSDIVIPFEPLWKQYERIIKENGAIVLFGQGMFYIDVSIRPGLGQDPHDKISKREENAIETT